MNKRHTYNILFYILSSNDPEKGGIERVSSILAGEFISRGCKVFSLSNVCPGRFNYTDSFVLPDPWCVSTRNSDYIKELVSTLNIDFIIAANMPRPLMMNNLTGLHGLVKIISHFHSSPRRAYSQLHFFEKYSVSNKKWFQNVAFEIQRRLKSSDFAQMCSMSDKIVLLHKSFIEELRLLSEIDESKVVSITNPMTFKDIECAFEGKEKIVLWVGRINESEKRISSLLRIWKMASPNMPGWRLRILGGGEELEKWKAKAESMGLKDYEFRGFCNPEEYYKTASIYVMTSNIEGWGMTLVEAMSYSCAPILFDSYACASDIVDGGKCGILVKPFDDKDFARKIIALSSDDVVRESLARRAHERSLLFSTEHAVYRWMELLNELMAKG